MDSDGESSVASETPIFLAAYDADADALRDALTDGADPNARNSEGYTAIQWLIRVGHNSRNEHTRLACISVLLEAGADPNISSGPDTDTLHDERGTPMSDAVFMLRSRPAACRAVVSLLIRHGADVNIGSEELGLTPLHIASIFGCCEIIPVLLAAGADVKAIYQRPSDDELWFTPETPLESAMEFARCRVYPLLLRAGAALPDLDDRDFDLPDEDCRYLQRVAEAGGYARYERAHCERLAAMFMPKPETGKGRRRSKRRRSPLHGLPAEVMHHIVSILWDCGGHCEGPLNLDA